MILVVDDTINKYPGKWFVWVDDTDWGGDYVYSVPEGVKKASEAGYPVTHWMRLSDKVKMSAEAINGSKQQKDKTNGHHS